MECLRVRSLNKQREYLATSAGRAKAASKTRAMHAKGYYRTPDQRSKSAAYMRKKRTEDVQHWLKDRLRKRLWDCLGGAVGRRSVEITGIAIADLKVYLESQFTVGMTWEKRGDWYIDHIRPCASFDLTDPEQQKQCFHYTNLQPLWAKDNLAKSDNWGEPMAA